MMMAFDIRILIWQFESFDGTAKLAGLD